MAKAIMLGVHCHTKANEDGNGVLQRTQGDQLPGGCSGWPDREGEAQAGLEVVSDTR